MYKLDIIFIFSNENELGPNFQHVVAFYVYIMGRAGTWVLDQSQIQEHNGPKTNLTICIPS